MSTAPLNLDHLVEFFGSPPACREAQPEMFRAGMEALEGYLEGLGYRKAGSVAGGGTAYKKNGHTVALGAHTALFLATAASYGVSKLERLCQHRDLL